MRDLIPWSNDNAGFIGLLALIFAIWKFFLSEKRRSIENIEEHLVDSPSQKPYKTTLRNYLEQQRLAKIRGAYFSKINRTLDWFTEYFGTPFSVKSLDRSILIAVLYPILLVLFFWGITGKNISGIAGFLLDSDTGNSLFSIYSLVRIWASVFPFFIGVYVYFTYFSKNKLSSLPWYMQIILLAFAGAGAVAGAFAFAFAFAAAVAVAGAVAVAAAVAGAVAVAVAVAFAVAFAGVGAGAVAVAVAFAGAGAGAGAVAVAGIAIVRRIRKEYIRRIIYFLCLLLIMSGIIFSVYNNLLFPYIKGLQGYIIFILIFPIINGVLDYISLGVTRWLLSRSMRVEGVMKKLGWALIDIALAFVCMIILIAVLTSAITMINYINIHRHGEVAVMDLSLIRDTLETNPRSINLWWLYIMLFSTFVPTLIHFCIVLSSVIISFFAPSERTKETIRRHLEVLDTTNFRDNDKTNEIRKRKDIAKFIFKKSQVVTIPTVLALLVLGGLFMTFVIPLLLRQMFSLFTSII